jgi:hypothetical protein
VNPKSLKVIRPRKRKILLKTSPKTTTPPVKTKPRVNNKSLNELKKNLPKKLQSLNQL